MKAIIIDDEENSRITLRHYLLDYCPEVILVAEANSVSSGIAAINEKQPDIVFLDIIMPDGTGFTLLENFKNINFKTIFITAFNDFAIKAFKFSAVDYILKPINIDELKAAIKKISELPSLHPNKEMIELLLDNVSKPKSIPQKIMLSSRGNSQIVEINSIMRCEARQNYTLFYLVGREEILVTKTLKEYDELLKDSNFIRVHKTHLVNTCFIKKYIKTDGGYIIMEDGVTIPVSYRKRENVLCFLKNVK